MSWQREKKRSKGTWQNRCREKEPVANAPERERKGVPNQRAQVKKGGRCAEHLSNAAQPRREKARGSPSGRKDETQVNLTVGGIRGGPGSEFQKRPALGIS